MKKAQGSFPSLRLSLAVFFYYSFVFVMGSDPTPNEVLAVFDSKGPMTNADSCRPEIADLLEMKRWM